MAQPVPQNHQGHQHPHPHPHPHPQQGPPQAIAPPQPPDPIVVAAIDAQFREVPLQVSNGTQVLCRPHSLETCKECDVDFASLNGITKMLQNQPELAVPPPANIVPPGRTQAVQKAKEEGNVCSFDMQLLVSISSLALLKNLYKQKKYPQAIQMYNMAANLASTRPPWEASQLLREELSIVICNRSAAHYAGSDFVSALVDADVVIQLKRPWSKGHFRKGKALLGLGKPEEAKEAISLGLQFEPDNQVRSTVARTMTGM
jgi:translocation protein SEC72